MHRRLVNIYLLNVPSFSSRNFNKIKRMSRLGRLLALSLEILTENEENLFFRQKCPGVGSDLKLTSSGLIGGVHIVTSIATHRCFP